MRNKRPNETNETPNCKAPVPPISMLDALPGHTDPTEMGVYFARAPTPPRGRKHNIEMRGAGLLPNCEHSWMGVYFANTGLEKEGLR